MNALLYILSICLSLSLVAMDSKQIAVYNEENPLHKWERERGRYMFFLINNIDNLNNDDCKGKVKEVSFYLGYLNDQEYKGLQTLFTIKNSLHKSPCISKEELCNINAIPHDIRGKILQKDKQKIVYALPWYQPSQKQCSEMYNTGIISGCLLASTALYGTIQGNGSVPSLQECLAPATAGFFVGLCGGALGKYLLTTYYNTEKKHYEKCTIYKKPQFIPKLTTTSYKPHHDYRPLFAIRAEQE